MRKLLILLLLSLTIGLNGQMIGILSSQGGVADGCPSVTYTVDFTGYNGAGATLNGQGSWLLGISDVYSYSWGGSIIVYGNGAGLHAMRYNDTFCNNQWSQIQVKLVGAYVGVGVRLSGSGASASGYGYYVNNGESKLVRIDAGSETILASGTHAISTDDVIKLEIVGTELSCFINGALDTTIDTDGKFTDATYSTGQGGIVCAGNASAFADNWQGGNK